MNARTKYLSGVAAVAVLLLAALLQAGKLPDGQPNKSVATRLKPHRPKVASPKASPKTAPKSVSNTPQRLAQRLPRMVEVGAEKCIPCIMMQPVLKDLRSRYAGQLQVDFVDIWKNPSAGEALKVNTIPTQIFFDAQGREIYRHTGYYSTAQIIKRFGELGIRFKS